MPDSPVTRERRASGGGERGGVAVLSPDAMVDDGAAGPGPFCDRCAWAGASRWWFDALDERRVGQGAASWVAQVTGIHEVRPHLWIQLESADTTRRVVLHVTLETRLGQALAAIAACPCDAHSLTLIDVQRTRP